LLIFSILLQPVVAYLATPAVAQDQRGHYVLLCTLKGLQEVYIEGGQASVAAADEEYCPALKLFNLISGAKTATAFQVPDPGLYTLAFPDARLDRPVILDKPSVYPIRAPPLS
jgi:hypothetical protein